MNKIVLTFAICRLIVKVGLTMELTDVLRLAIDGQLSLDRAEVESASKDFGSMKRTKPLAVLHPASAEDVARIVRAAYGSSRGLTVSARGHGHSINGQAQSKNGVVIEMSRWGRKERESARPRPRVSVQELYVDVWGGELWIQVLRHTLMHGLAPKSWTDYLYLSVGGTLSNAGISGQTFNHGPQISNVHELDVVTGKGELMTCSEEKNSELFYAVLGGLGQFGIITRARIALEPAPQRVKWLRVLYSDFSAFTKDQEFLISLHGHPGPQKFDYVEGFVIVDDSLINNWRSSFCSPLNPIKLSSVNPDGGVLYCLEITKNYDETTADTVDEDIEALLKKLEFIPNLVFKTDVPYVDFLDRVHTSELKLRSQGLWDVPHPWINLFVPKSKISDFDKVVFKRILGKNTSGPILIYPMNKDKWNERSSVVTPDEDVFYVVGLLRSAAVSSSGTGGDETQSVDYLTQQNGQILKYCAEAGIMVKKYLPHYETQEEWMDHYGEKWEQFQKLKKKFDPRRVLATGQRIFINPPLKKKQ
ncbi:cytokinin dehydrogenase 5 [Humulus lupulus]|uniref:cytokinin dehydrogenase 5 n=1 Tax=Humulus lupulus TaxID=3486 RepID=UPI002B418138|nr:cytokinin dehydrogenase 5 [Humulus lupulus]